jgi:hypothetical protein
MSTPNSYQFSSERLQKQFNEVIAESNLTTYQIGQIWATETDDNPNTMRVRIDTWLKSQPKALRDFANLMDVLGYVVEIRKK